ncbi:MAG: flagellar hook-length control protein FliK [Sphingopyxis sp.]|uniref:flagellar hook-length control protein FliK n=1 Tax=Sphingopyxis sp. TaxID=1908224 RepID=UPI002ABD087E|nr:flagellar hook-length control protein FliK [Sphingopyxis sp.]MDZ3831835.1 flagellar hook-length control protein FliK [Sphingopyxis sp.]
MMSALPQMPQKAAPPGFAAFLATFGHTLGEEGGAASFEKLLAATPGAASVDGNSAPGTPAAALAPFLPKGGAPATFRATISSATLTEAAPPTNGDIALSAPVPTEPLPADEAKEATAPDQAAAAAADLLNALYGGKAVLPPAAAMAKDNGAAKAPVAAPDGETAEDARSDSGAASADGKPVPQTPASPVIDASLGVTPRPLEGTAAITPPPVAAPIAPPVAAAQAASKQAMRGQAEAPVTPATPATPAAPDNTVHPEKADKPGKVAAASPTAIESSDPETPLAAQPATPRPNIAGGQASAQPRIVAEPQVARPAIDNSASMTVLFTQNATSAAAPHATHESGSPAPVADRLLDMSSDDMWIDQLARDIAATKSETGDISFRLMPRHLGRLDVAMTQGEEGVSLKFDTQHETTATIVQAAQGKLVEDLRQQGVRVAGAEVTHTPGDSGRQSQQGQGRGHAHDPAHLIETAPERANEDKRRDEGGAERRGRFA